MVKLQPTVKHKSNCAFCKKRKEHQKKQVCLFAVGIVAGAAVTLSIVYRKQIGGTAEKYYPVIKETGEEKIQELVALSKKLSAKVEQMYQSR